MWAEKENVNNCRIYIYMQEEDYEKDRRIRYKYTGFSGTGNYFQRYYKRDRRSDGLKLAIDSLDDLLEGVDYDVVAGAESRGFIFGTPLAYKNGKGFALVRKKGKLPRETIEASYDLEYGSATIEMHKDAIKPGQKVVLVDDLIATGGTMEAAARLVEELGGKVVKIIFLIELAGLKGRERLAKYDVASVICYDGK